MRSAMRHCTLHLAGGAVEEVENLTPRVCCQPVEEGSADRSLGRQGRVDSRIVDILRTRQIRAQLLPGSFDSEALYIWPKIDGLR